MGAPAKVHPRFVSSTYRITELQYTYGNATLSAAYVRPLPTKSLGYITLMGVQP